MWNVSGPPRYLPHADDGYGFVEIVRQQQY